MVYVRCICIAHEGTEPQVYVYICSDVCAHKRVWRSLYVLTLSYSFPVCSRWAAAARYTFVPALFGRLFFSCARSCWLAPRKTRKTPLPPTIRRAAQRGQTNQPTPATIAVCSNAYTQERTYIHTRPPPSHRRRCRRRCHVVPPCAPIVHACIHTYIHHVLGGKFEHYLYMSHTRMHTAHRSNRSMHTHTLQHNAPYMYIV